MNYMKIMKNREEILRFEPSDIKYIIVSRDNEIIPVIKGDRTNFESKYDENQIKLYILST